MTPTTKAAHVIGAGGHAKVVVQTLRDCGYDVQAIYDDNPEKIGGQVCGVPVVGKVELLPLGGPTVIAIGNNTTRKELAAETQADWLTVVHPSAVVDDTASLGEGTVVLARCVVQAEAKLGRHVILNTASVVDHDSVVGDFVHVCPGVRLPGEVTVEEGVTLGTGTVAIPGVTIGAWTTVGAGSVVIRDLPANCTAMGRPARPKNEPTSTDAAAPTAKRIYMSPPHMSGDERELLLDAFDSNWIAPLGPHVNAFEQEFAATVEMPHAVALASGTSALHLALLLLGVECGDEVLTSSFTFVASTNAIRYVGAQPVFIDSDRETWNMDPNLLAEELHDCQQRGQRPKAVLVVDVNGQCANYETIQQVCDQYDVPIIEDAAESLGARYKGRSAGTFGKIACFSFNGNKIITTSGGGMLVTQQQAWAEKARFLATQARDPAVHYEHSHVGFNYRMSNLLAAVGRGQLRVLPERVEKRRANFDYYRTALGDLPGITFMPEPEDHYSTQWLSAMLIDEQQFGASWNDVRLALEAENIESRPLWKPMHMQPVYQSCRVRGGAVSEQLFRQGLCLPSGSDLTEETLRQIVEVIKEARGARDVRGASGEARGARDE